MAGFAFVFQARARRASACSTPGASIRRDAPRWPRPRRRSARTSARLIHEGPKEQLDLTTNTQPVMLTAAIACYRAWMAETGRAPAVVAGTRWANTPRWSPPAR